MLLLLLGFVLFAAALLMLVRPRLRPAAERRASLRRVVSYATTQQTTRAPIEKRPGFSETVVPMLSRVALRLTPRVQSDQLETRLAAAGVKRLNAQQFLALKTVLAVLGVVFGFGIGGLSFGGFVLAGAARRVRAAPARLVPRADDARPREAPHGRAPAGDRPDRDLARGGPRLRRGRLVLRAPLPARRWRASCGRC